MKVLVVSKLAVERLQFSFAFEGKLVDSDLKNLTVRENKPREANRLGHVDEHVVEENSELFATHRFVNDDVFDSSTTSSSVDELELNDEGGRADDLGRSGTRK